MALSYQQIQTRKSLDATASTVQINTSIPTNSTIESLIIKVDGLQNGATDSTDMALAGKLNLITLMADSVKTEINHTDLVRFNQRVWNSPVTTMISEDDGEGVSVVSTYNCNPITVNGNTCFDEPYGAPPNSIRNINISYNADIAATDNTFLTVWACTNTKKSETLGYTQFKRTERDCIAGSIIDDPINDLSSFMGWGSWVYIGPKDVTAAIPAALTVRGVQLISGGAIMDQVTGDAMISGGVRYASDSNSDTLVTIKNYDFMWLDFGIRSGGRPLPQSSYMRVEEGASNKRRSYACGLGF
tara:strand:+ start:1203 stop:2105 length:903 start_codon:yes stop_codon:yes gene_type:complete